MHLRAPMTPGPTGMPVRPAISRSRRETRPEVPALRQRRHASRWYLAVLALALAGCSGTTPAAPDAVAQAGADAPDDAAPPPPDLADDTQMDELDSFIPEGAVLVESVRGDLTGRGGQDVALVYTPAADADADAEPGDGPARTVALLVRDAGGTLSQVASNPRMVPCARCGGLAGDPYAYMTIQAGTLTVSVAGGSRERWFDDYTFTYVHDQDTWMLTQVARGVTDTHTDAQVQVDMDADELGQITFTAFDPDTLPRRAVLD